MLRGAQLLADSAAPSAIDCSNPPHSMVRDNTAILKHHDSWSSRQYWRHSSTWSSNLAHPPFYRKMPVSLSSKRCYRLPLRFTLPPFLFLIYWLSYHAFSLSESTCFATLALDGSIASSHAVPEQARLSSHFLNSQHFQGIVFILATQSFRARKSKSQHSIISTPTIRISWTFIASTYGQSSSHYILCYLCRTRCTASRA